MGGEEGLLGLIDHDVGDASLAEILFEGALVVMAALAHGSHDTRF